MLGARLPFRLAPTPSNQTDLDSRVIREQYSMRNQSGSGCHLGKVPTVSTVWTQSTYSPTNFPSRLAGTGRSVHQSHRIVLRHSGALISTRQRMVSSRAWRSKEDMKGDFSAVRRKEKYQTCTSRLFSNTDYTLSTFPCMLQYLIPFSGVKYE